MHRNKGVSLLEFIVAIVIIGIMVAMLLFISSRKANSHMLVPSGISAVLDEAGVQYTWNNQNHHLIIDKGTADWTTAEDVCKALDGNVENVFVTLRSNTGAGELTWQQPKRNGEARKLTNLPTSSTAKC